MSSWVDSLPAFTIALVLVFVPGLAVATAAGARGWLRWAVAAPTTFTLAGVGAIILAALGIPFTVWTFAGGTILATAGVWLTARFIRHRGPLRDYSLARATDDAAHPASRRMLTIATAAGLLVGGGVTAAQLLNGIGSPTAIAQLFDNVFHLNAVALIHSTADGSSLTLGNLTPESQMFYPAAFHDVASLLLGVGISDVSVVMNAMSIVLAAVVWPLSLMYLATRIFGERVDVLLLTGTLAGLFAAFPYRLFSFGVLYSFLAALTMVPVLIALLIETFGMGASRGRPLRVSVAALIAISPGIALTHPSVIVAALVLAGPFVVWFVIVEVGYPASRPLRRAGIVLALAYLVATAATFAVVRPPLNSAPWIPIQSYREAVGSIVLLSPGTAAVSWFLVPLVAVGLVQCVRRFRVYAPVLGMFVVGGVLYFACAAVGNPFVRDVLTGVWYRDPNRISAIFVIAALPLAVLGASTIARLLAFITRPVVPGAAESTRLTISAALASVVIVGLSQFGPLPEARIWLAQSFGQGGGQALLSDDERALLKEATEIVPSDGTIVGDPRKGASLTPAFARRNALAPHIFGNRTPAEQLLLDRWDEAGSDPEVCDAIRDLDAYWALDFGQVDVLGDSTPQVPGVANASASPGITELARVGEAVLYEASACR